MARNHNIEIFDAKSRALHIRQDCKARHGANSTRPAGMLALLSEGNCPEFESRRVGRGVEESAYLASLISWSTPVEIWPPHPRLRSSVGRARVS